MSLYQSWVDNVDFLVAAGRHFKAAGSARGKGWGDGLQRPGGGAEEGSRRGRRCIKEVKRTTDINRGSKPLRIKKGSEFADGTAAEKTVGEARSRGSQKRQ